MIPGSQRCRRGWVVRRLRRHTRWESPGHTTFRCAHAIACQRVRIRSGRKAGRARCRVRRARCGSTSNRRDRFRRRSCRRRSRIGRGRSASGEHLGGWFATSAEHVPSRLTATATDRGERRQQTCSNCSTACITGEFVFGDIRSLHRRILRQGSGFLEVDSDVHPLRSTVSKGKSSQI